MTHIEIQEDLLPLVGKVEQVLDGITGFVEHYDFSKANSSYESRVQAVTNVASICYGNPKSLGSINLFNRLEAEAAGLPSSSYEFVPVLITKEQFAKVDLKQCYKFGELVADEQYLLTNLRALIADVGSEESLNYLNTSEEEIQIIRDNFKVFLFNVDLSTRAQMVRHRCSWQELSRRYVSGKKQPFEFYISKKMENVESEQEVTYFSISQFGEQELDFQQYLQTEDIVNLCVQHYDAAIATGVKPEEARRILPQAMVTTIWGAFQPNQLKNFFTLRLDSHAQKEVRCVAEAMKELI